MMEYFKALSVFTAVGNTLVFGLACTGIALGLYSLVNRKPTTK